MSAKIQPVAWAVCADSFGDDGPAVCKHREVSERLAREVGGRLVPLLATDCAAQAPDFAPQAPDNGNATLTDAERELLDTLRRSEYLLPHGVKIIDGLLERLGNS